MFENFPLGIHIIFIPATLGVGFVLGWIIRGSAERQGDPRRQSGPPGAR